MEIVPTDMRGHPFVKEGINSSQSSLCPYQTRLAELSPVEGCEE
jgi:hypothetical protein